MLFCDSLRFIFATRTKINLLKAKASNGEFLKNSLSELMSLSRAGISPVLSGTLMKKITHFLLQKGRIYFKNRDINLDAKGFI